ncbi:unnamed protein product [Mucor hiemalis]
MPSLFITFDEKSQPLELNYNKKSPLSWCTLVDSIIHSNTETCIDLPLVLYYKTNTGVKSVESEPQLQTLLTQGDQDSIYLFGTAQLADNDSVVIKEQPQQSPPPVSAFNRLGQLIDNHKRIISSSQHLSRCVGILASAIALDKNNKDFDKEFKALEKVIELRKDASSTNGEEEDVLMTAFTDHSRGRGRPGFGRGFGGHHRHAERGEFSGRGHHHAERGRGHHHGPPTDSLSMMAMDEKLHKRHKKAQACFRGSRGQSSSGDEMDVLQSRMKNTHIHSKDKKKHNRGGNHPFDFY